MNRTHRLGHGNGRECNQEKGNRFHLACNDDAEPFQKSGRSRVWNRSCFRHSSVNRVVRVMRIA